MNASEFIAAHSGAWQATLRDLISLPSTFEHEHAVLARVETAIAACGQTAIRVPHHGVRLASLPAAQPPFSSVDGRHSLVARLNGAGEGRSMVLSAHLDIVPEGDRHSWTREPFGGEIDAVAGVIFGRGAMDDKAGAAISLAVLEVLAKAPVRLRGDVVFHYVIENETTGNGSLLCLADGHTADAVAIIDGTRPDRLINEHAGQLQFELTVQGRAASVAVSHMGRNAAELIADLVLDLRKAIFALNDGRVAPWTSFPSPFQLSVQRLHSEGVQLTLPERAEALCYVTFPPPFTLSRMRELITDRVCAWEAAGREDSTSIAWSGLAVEPTRADAGALQETIIEAARRHGIERVTPGPSTGTSDLRHFVAAGIPGILYGPGTGYNPHRPDEQYQLSDLATMVAIYVDALISWCGLAR